MKSWFRIYVKDSTYLARSRYVGLSLSGYFKCNFEAFCANEMIEMVHYIQATALIFFKRFYLKWSVMEHQPKHIM